MWDVAYLCVLFYFETVFLWKTHVFCCVKDLLSRYAFSILYDCFSVKNFEWLVCIDMYIRPLFVTLVVYDRNVVNK